MLRARASQPMGFMQYTTLECDADVLFRKLLNKSPSSLSSRFLLSLSCLAPVSGKTCLYPPPHPRCSLTSSFFFYYFSYRYNDGNSRFIIIFKHNYYYYRIFHCVRNILFGIDKI